MLGNLSSSYNSIFLSVQWITVLLLSTCLTVQAQSALQSEHFVFFSNPRNQKVAEKSLLHLEQLRAALITLHGENWIAPKPLYVWLPDHSTEWLKIAIQPQEQGLFFSGERSNWIIVNPATGAFNEVLSHEYVHAVLHRTIPNLPTWFEEGICEFYSTLAVRGRDFAVGVPPVRRLRELSDVSTIKIADFASGIDYARAWAAAYRIFPGWRPGDPFPASVPVGPFPPVKHRLTTVPATGPFTLLTRDATNAIARELALLIPSYKNPLADIDSELISASRLADQGDPAAIPMLERICPLTSGNHSCWYTLAFAALEANQPERARPALEQARRTALTPSEAKAVDNLATRLPR